jgi:RNA polymerase sigma-70 factor (ECF subfamily)
VSARRLAAVPASDAPAPADDAAAVFTAERRRLVGLAYRITGSLTDADDVVQEAWLRFQRTGPETVERPAAWLTTVVARLALDHLKAARHQREVYVGPWLPEPVVSDPSSVAQPGPEEMAELAQSLTMGFLRVLESLGPVERVVFVLADVFDTPYAELAEVVGKSPAACRQLASRARKRVREGGPPRYQPPGEDVARTIGELLVATTSGDMDQVVRLLADDAVLVSDGGPNRRAARHPVKGPQRMARFLVNLGHRYEQITMEPVALNGELGMVVYVGDERLLAMAVHVEDGKVRAIHSVLNPDKLAALDRDIDLV